MMATREAYWPPGVTMVRADYTEDQPVVARAAGVFVAPSGPSRRAVPVGSSGCTLTQDVSSDRPAPDPHFDARALATEAKAAEISRAAADSILRPARFAGSRFDR
jgi:hypothetical protein